VNIKRSVMEAFLRNGDTRVFFVPGRAGVQVPERVKQLPYLGLDFSWKAPMEVSDWGIKATIYFGGNPFPCGIPWGSVFGMVNDTLGQSEAWIEDGPPRGSELPLIHPPVSKMN